MFARRAMVAVDNQSTALLQHHWHPSVALRRDGELLTFRGSKGKVGGLAFSQNG